MISYNIIGEKQKRGGSHVLSKKTQISLEFIFIAVYIIIGINILLGTPHVGLANNGDYWRVVQEVGIEDSIKHLFYNSERFFDYASDNNVAKVKYFSTQIPVVKISKYLSIHFYGKEKYDIHYLGFIYLLISSIGLFLLYDGLRRIFPKYFLITIAFLTFFFSDVGYISYYNSFFGEAALLSFMLLFLGIFVFTVAIGEINFFTLSLITTSAILFVGSKEANVPSGIVLAFLILVTNFLAKNKFNKSLVILSSLVVFVFSIYSYTLIPEEIKKVNEYQAISTGILKFSKTPVEDLKELGFNPALSAIVYTTYYGQNLPFEQDSEFMKKEFYDKFSYFKILKFYLSHPKRLYEVLEVTAANSTMIRPPYLGNHQFSDVKERLTFENKFSAWSSFKKIYMFHSLPALTIFFSLFSLVNIYQMLKTFKLEDKKYFIIASLCLFNAITAVINFALPILADGDSDLPKHLFYYNVNFDLMLAISATYLLYVLAKILNWLQKVKEKSISSRIFAISILLPLIITSLGITQNYTSDVNSSNTLKPGAFIEFGSFDGSPILWQVYYKDKEMIKLVSYKVLTVMKYSSSDPQSTIEERKKFGNNNWAVSDIREWLNSKFVSHFDSDEKELVVLHKHKTILPNIDKEMADGGNMPFLWSNVPEYVLQNYEKAYYKIVEDMAWIPDVKDIDEMRKAKISIRKRDNTGIYTPYWLSTPYAPSSSMVRYVASDGYIYHKDAASKPLGVVVCIAVKPDIKIVKGKGTYDSPFIIKQK